MHGRSASAHGKQVATAFPGAAVDDDDTEPAARIQATYRVGVGPARAHIGEPLRHV
jgi:hypothetical protein